MEDFDIQEFAKMFDAALASDNPSVKKALQNFMMVAALVHAQEEVENDERLSGPLETLIKQIEDLQHRISRLEAEKYSGTRTYPTNPYDNTWIYTGTGSYTTNITSTTTTNKDWNFDSSKIDDYSVDIQKYLNDALIDKKGP